MKFPSTQLLINSFRKKNVFTGFKAYNSPLLISYSRCGTNWVLHMIEFMSQGKVPRGMDKNGPFVVDRAHMGFKVINGYKKAILLLRDYKECIVRHHGVETVQSSDIESFLNKTSGSQPPNWYIKNIESFERFKGDKHVVYYEDLIQYPQESISSLASFLGLPGDLAKAYIDQIESFSNQSLSEYQALGHTTETHNNRENLKFHQQKLSGEELETFDSYFKSQLQRKGLFEKYLSRYS